jgi:pyruvate dehydrogenase E2 component (dihydrolipoamide acetyltransferase)
MPIEILMPALSPTMTEGAVATWLKKEGDAVESGDIIAEIETDKATMEIEAVDQGILGKILIVAGTDGVAVNQPIALLLEEGEDAASLTVKPIQTELLKPVQTQTLPVVKPNIPAVTEPKTGRIFASPLARRLASQDGIDLNLVQGSGPRGRVVKRDLEGVTAVPAPAPVTISQSENQPFTEVPNSSVHKVIAKRLSESKREVPHFYLSIDCNIDELLGMRKMLNDRQGADYKLSVNDFVVRAVALALRRVPAANASWSEDAIRLFNDVDVSVAVATEDGLITPIVRKADTKGLGVVSNEIKDLAARARDGKLMPEEFQGGGFTISNLGMYGIKDFAAIINPPQSCILAVGAGEQRPVVVDGALAVATVMSCTLSVDHRCVDGAVGAEFLAAFKQYVEEPLTMLL